MLTSKEQRQYASASSVVEEAISAIRTVVAYGGEGVETNRYRILLRYNSYFKISHGYIFLYCDQFELTNEIYQ